MTASRALYISHIEAVQNVVRLHNASSNAGLEEISASISSNAQSLEQVGSSNTPGYFCLTNIIIRDYTYYISFFFYYHVVSFYLASLLVIILIAFLLFSVTCNQFLAAEAIDANSIFDDLQGTLSSHQGEMAQFARELRQV